MSMYVDEFCMWIKQFDYYGKIVGIHTGYQLRMGDIKPIIEDTFNMTVEEDGNETVFIPEDDDAYAEFSTPSFFDLNKKYQFFVAYRKRFWVVFRREDDGG